MCRKREFSYPVTGVRLQGIGGLPMNNTPAHTTKQQTKKKFIVSREFSGNQSMKEAFEQLIERQTHSQFEEWLERKAG